MVSKCIFNAHAGEVFQRKQLSMTELQGGVCMHSASRADVNSTAEIDFATMSAVTPEKQVWNWVIALSIPCCFTNSYSCDNFPADVPKKIMCKFSFTLCDRKITDRSSLHNWDPYNDLTVLHMNNFYRSVLIFLKRLKFQFWYFRIPLWFSLHILYLLLLHLFFPSSDPYWLE